jgi:spoIIIJ-associated protein
MKKTDYVIKLFKFLGIDKNNLKIELKDEERAEFVDAIIPEEKAGFVIGFKGETIDSIELLLNLSFQDKEKKIVLDVNKYRAQKQERLLEKARRLADKALETGQEQSLWSLNSYERFLVHSEISGDSDFASLETTSQDDYDGRTLVIRVRM